MTLGILGISSGRLLSAMLSQLKFKIKKGHQMTAVGLGVACAVSAAVALGLFESIEIGIFDQFIRWSGSRKITNERILVVTIDEDDITTAGSWPISDKVLAQIVRTISEHEPASIGLDLYRNLPVEPGVDELKAAFAASPDVVGIERVVGTAVPAHPTLIELGQTASSDLVVDTDGKVRRGLLTVIAHNGEVKQGLAARLALDYLAELGIEPEVLEGEGRRLSLQLGKGRVTRFEQNDGGYVGADPGGFQVLMNYHGPSQQFESVSLTSVLDGELTDELVNGRIVLLGSTAVSLNDLFYTPFEKDEQVAGVYVHAHLLNQLLKVALEGEPFVMTVPDVVEWLWTLGWVMASIMTSRSMLYSKSLKSDLSAWRLMMRLIGLGSGLGLVSYGLFWLGWWLPVALPMISMVVMTALGIGYRNFQLQNLAAFDELTQVANRRYFDQYLAEALKSSKQLALILCDVDYFKAFNDRYGHPAGDFCLKQVAAAITQAIRESDMVARYGGEEFVIVLPDTTDSMAMSIAGRIQQEVQQLQIKHEGSRVDDYVTLSCGTAAVSPGFSLLPLQLVEYADQALYEAKQSGRNRVVASQWQMLKQSEPYSDEAA